MVFKKPAVNVWSYVTFMCFLSELGCVQDLSHPIILQLYGLSLVCTWECFFLSEELANLLSQPLCSHLNGFSPTTTNNTCLTYCIAINKLKIQVQRTGWSALLLQSSWPLIQFLFSVHGISVKHRISTKHGIFTQNY